MGRGDRNRSSRTAANSQGNRRDRHRSKSPRDKDKSKDKSRRSRSPRDRKEGERRPDEDEKRRRPNEPPSRPLGRREKEKEELDLGEIVRMADKDEAEKKLEIEMQKRRERIEKWRTERPKPNQAAAALKEEPEVDDDLSHKKGWTLEDEDDDDLDDSTAGTTDIDDNNTKPIVKEEVEDDAPPKPSSSPLNDLADMETTKSPLAVKEEESMDTTETKSAAEVEEVDPLDAFMRQINTEIRGPRPGAAAGGKARVVVVKQVTKSNPLKGDIIEPEEEQEAANDDFDLEQAAATLLSKGRQLPLTDHNKVYYRPFRKNFYVEVPELARMTNEEVEKYREELESIKVRGKNCPKPIKTWAQCGVEYKMLDVLKKSNYIKPTPIQAQAIPAIMCGRDVIGIAKTGSGKTLAFLLPMFRHIMDQPELDEMDGPIAMIMSPTRELAMQTWKEAKKFARVLNLRVVCVYGGAGISEQIADLKRGAEIVVCTPGRLIDMLAANNGKVTNLRRVTYLVLDEADRMFDMGFEPQVTKIVNNIRPDRQTVLFSATFPRQMEALARKVLVKPIEIQVGSRSVVCKDVTQHAVICEEHQKFLKLLELLGVYWECGNVLVFVEKQENADELVGDLMKHGYNCAPLHGGIDQFDRESTIIDFKSGKIKLMVATSVAARGLDVKKLILVVNYDCPNHYEDYVHRVGRTGRAGNKGYSYTFVLPEGQERLAGDVCRAFEMAGQTPPDDLKEMWETFQAKMKSEGKEVRQGGGFSGHGFKFDEAEDEAEATKRKMTKLVHGLEAGVEDDDDEIENQITSIMKSKTRVVEASKKAPGPTTHANLGALEKAKMLAHKISQDKNLGGVVERDAASRTAEAVMRGGEAAPITISAKAVAQQVAEQLNEKLNYIPSELHPGVDTELDLQYFEEELEINDFPQQVRWRVCSRECIGQVQEYADVGISVKGSFYPPNKEPKDGERKLFLFIEARSELALARAKTEVIRIMKDSLRQLASQASKGGQMGRYKVV